ncbi:MAG: TonB-dependent receptor [Opitutus sp.]|nr:TonB-dependent receptor [Opitutus sp.]
MKSKNTIALLIGWVALALAAAAPAAGADTRSPAGQESVTGVVTNSGTGRTLEGARVELVGAGRETLTDNQGVYRFTGVAPGSAVLSVSYTGLNKTDIPVTVTAGQPNRNDVGLTSDIYTLSTFVVSGEREGNAQAITLQKKSFGVKNVVSQDAFGSLAGNPSELLVRLPGVSGIEQDGDIRYIQVRGLSGGLTSVTRDGNRMADASSSSREYLFQQSTSDSVERFEVVKSPTPDMDADSIGGSVNMVTKSAFDSKAGRRIGGTFGMVWRPMIDGRDNSSRMNYTASYSEVFRDRVGVSFNYGTRKHFNPISTTSSSYQNIVADPAYLYNFQTNDFLTAKEREGVDLKLDYKLSDATRFSVSGSTSTYFEHFYINNTQYSTSQAIATVAANGTLTGTGTIVPGFTNNVTEWRPLTGTTLNVNGYDAGIKKGADHAQFNGVHRFTGLAIDYDAYRSGSRVHSGPSDRMAVIVRSIGLRFNRPDPSNHVPSITQVSGPDITKIGSYTENQYTSSDVRNQEKYWGVSLNAKKDFATVVPTWLKAGFRVRDQHRDLSSNPYTGVYVGPDGVAGVNPATGVSDDNLAQFVNPAIQTTGDFLDQMPKVPFPSRPNTYRNPGNNQISGANVNAGSLLMAKPELFRRNIAADLITNLTGNQSFSERINAAYIVGNMELGKITVLGGLRVEDTKTEGVGALQQITPAEAALRAAWVGPVTDAETIRRTNAQYGARRKASGDYRSIFPGLHFKYSPAPNLVARLSYATNIGRPSIGQLIPSTTVNIDNQTVSTSNPSLKPQYANNFDAGIEYYFEPVGMLSAGVFLKEMKDFIFTQTGIIVPAGADNGFGGDYAGYTMTTQRNGGFAKIKGFELAYQQQFTFLPGWMSGFGGYANYTKIRTEGNYGATNPIATNLVADFIPETFNVGLSYLKNRISIRAQYRYRSSYLQSANAAQARLRFAGKASFTDVKTVYTLSKHFSVYLDVTNIFNHPDRNWFFYGDRAGYVAEIFSPLFSFGATARF